VLFGMALKNKTTKSKIALLVGTFLARKKWGTSSWMHLNNWNTVVSYSCWIHLCNNLTFARGKAYDTSKIAVWFCCLQKLLGSHLFLAGFICMPHTWRKDVFIQLWCDVFKYGIVLAFDKMEVCQKIISSVSIVRQWFWICQNWLGHYLLLADCI